VAVRVASFKVEKKNMAEALVALVSGDRKDIVIGFERIPHIEGERGRPITLAVADATVGEVVRRLCQADPRYEYQVVENSVVQPDLKGAMIEIRPRGALNDTTDLLNIRVRDYKVDANIAPETAIEHIHEDAPELREFLYRKAEEWVERTGRHPAAFGSILSGNMVPPRFTLHLQDVTVRQILDEISMRSIQMFKEGPNFDSSGRGLRSGPTGWQYDFVTNPDAGTGLGGYPRWTSF
jgi:hypothetical protein